MVLIDGKILQGYKPTYRGGIFDATRIDGEIAEYRLHGFDAGTQLHAMDREGLERLIARVLKQMPKLAFVDEIIEFLGRGPQPEEIVAFHSSEKSQERIRELLDKNRAGTLTGDEEGELDLMESLNHLFALVKARAWQHLPAVS